MVTKQPKSWRRRLTLIGVVVIVTGVAWFMRSGRRPDVILEVTEFRESDDKVFASVLVTNIGTLPATYSWAKGEGEFEMKVSTEDGLRHVPEFVYLNCFASMRQDSVDPGRFKMIKIELPREAHGRPLTVGLRYRYIPVSERLDGFLTYKVFLSSWMPSGGTAWWLNVRNGGSTNTNPFFVTWSELSQVPGQPVAFKTTYDPISED